jgi:hypothetical protein
METESTDKRLWTRVSEGGNSAAAGMSLGSGGGMKIGGGHKPQPYGYHGWYGVVGGGSISGGYEVRGKITPPREVRGPVTPPVQTGKVASPSPTPLNTGGRVGVSTKNDDLRKDDPNPEALPPETRKQVQTTLDKAPGAHDVNMNSGYRSGEKGPHGEGQAADINRINGQRVSDANNPNVPVEQREVMRERLDEIKSAAEENENVEAYLGPNGGFFRRADGKIGRRTTPEEDEAHQNHVHITIRKPPLLRP